MSYAILFSVNTECKYNKKSLRLHILFGLFAISPSFFGIYVPPWGKMESLLFKQSEEEVYGSILHGNTSGIPYHTMIRVSDSPIIIDSTQNWIVIVSHRPIRIDISQDGVVWVSNSAPIKPFNQMPIRISNVTVVTDSGNKTNCYFSLRRWY